MLKCIVGSVNSEGFAMALVAAESKKLKLLIRSINKTITIKIAIPKKVKFFLLWRNFNMFSVKYSPVNSDIVTLKVYTREINYVITFFNI